MQNAVTVQIGFSSPATLTTDISWQLLLGSGRQLDSGAS